MYFFILGSWEKLGSVTEEQMLPSLICMPLGGSLGVQVCEAQHPCSYYFFFISTKYFNAILLRGNFLLIFYVFINFSIISLCLLFF